jgi:UDP-N-acetylmuramoylalanine--D-glutamate ligase
VRVADTRAAPPYLAELNRRGAAGADFLPGEFDKALLEGIDLLVLSPGLPGDLPVVMQARAAGIPVVGEIELFAWALHRRAPAAPVLAITGTNGKTTTTALTGHLLRAPARRVGVAGNISPAALTALMDAEDARPCRRSGCSNCRASSWKPRDTLNPAAATVLNVFPTTISIATPDLDDYAAAKARIFQRRAGAPGSRCSIATTRGCAPWLPRAAASSASASMRRPARGFRLRQNRGEPWLVQGERLLLPLAELPLAGLHNAANAWPRWPCAPRSVSTPRPAAGPAQLSAACRTASKRLPRSTASPGTTTPRAPMSAPRSPR